MKLIDKDAVVAEIERARNQEVQWMERQGYTEYHQGLRDGYSNILSFLNTLEVKDPYEQCVQYDSIKDGIQAHAETYSFNIESLLFNQLTKEQQKLWRKEIEQACISGGEMGVELAKDARYKENLEVKEVDLTKEIKKVQQKYKTIDEYKGYPATIYADNIKWIAKHFFELGMAVSNKAQKL